MQAYLLLIALLGAMALAAPTPGEGTSAAALDDGGGKGDVLVADGF